MSSTLDDVLDDQEYLRAQYAEDDYMEEQRNDLFEEMRQEVLAAVMSDLSRTERRSFQRPIKRGVANRRGKKQGGKKSASTSSDGSASPSPSNRSAVTPNALNGVLLGGVR